MKYTLGFRVWHWLNAIVVLGLLGTVFLRKTFLSWRTNSEIILEKLTEIDIEITSLQAKVLAKSIRAGMWEWHIILGYALSFLLIYRIYLFIYDKSEKKVFSSLSLHHRLVKVSYYLIYMTIFFMVMSGLSMHFNEFLNLSKEISHDIKEIHELASYLLVFFVPLHILGIIITENKDEKGLILSMINGKK